jgi:urease accessory protein
MRTPTSTHISTSMTEHLALTRLLQLCSANLPIGGFAFSQGLEPAIEAGWISNKVELQQWVSTIMTEAMLNTDLPLLHKQRQAIVAGDAEAFNNNEDWICATRETSEILMAEKAIGSALLRLLKNLEFDQSAPTLKWLGEHKKLSFISSFAMASYLFELDTEATLTGFAWAFIDNQVAAGVKLIPLGQTDGQNLLFTLSTLIPTSVKQCIKNCESDTNRCNANATQLIDNTKIGQSLAGLAIASSKHEQQYSRLFRS